MGLMCARNVMDGSCMEGCNRDRSSTHVAARNPRWENTCDTHLATMESQGKWNPSTNRIPEDTRINEDLLYKEMSSPSRLRLFKKIPMRKRLLHQGRDVNLLLLQKPQYPHKSRCT